MSLWWLPSLLRVTPVCCNQSDSSLPEVQELYRQRRPFSIQVLQSALFQCDSLPVPSYRLSVKDAAILGLGSKAHCAIFHPVRDQFVQSEFSGLPRQYPGWRKLTSNPLIFVNTETDFFQLFRERNPQHCFDSIVVSYIPEEDKEKLSDFEDAATLALTKDGTSYSLLTEGKSHTKFVVVRKKELAEKLALMHETYLGEHEDDLIIYRYYPPDSPLAQHTLDDYRTLEQIQTQTAGYLRYHFLYDPSVRQVRLKLMREKIILRRNTKNVLNYEPVRDPFRAHVTHTVKELGKELTQIRPLIYPLTCFNDMKIMAFPLLLKIAKTKLPVLVLSAKETDPIAALNALEFRSVAKHFSGKVISILAVPHLFAHSHIKEVHLRHKRKVEIRLFLIGNEEYPTVVRQYRYGRPYEDKGNGGQIQDWVQRCLDGKEFEYVESEDLPKNWEIMTEENYESVLSTPGTWVWVGDRPPDFLKSLKNVYILPLHVELPKAKLTPGLHRVRNRAFEFVFTP